MVGHRVDLRLPAGPQAAGLARHAVDELEGEVSPMTLEDGRLLVSELVTNSVRHAGLPGDASILLSIRLLPGGLRVEVTDAGPGFDPGGRPSPGVERGWGLYLVERISKRWGVTRDPHTLVWFELDR